MKGQQKTAETEEGTVQIQEGAVATGEDPTSVAIASIQSSATFPDPNVKYVFRAENGGQVMYRVIQVSEGQLDGQTEGTGAISGYPAAQSMTQAVIQGAFTSDEAADTEGTAAETHYAYFPGAAVGDGAGTAAGSAAAVVTTQGSEALLGQATPPGTGQFFVMMSPQEVLQGGSQRSIAPRTHPYSPKSEAPRTTRDEKRRAQHNEVERRRRDKINNWIVQLSKIIPDCSMESTKSGQSKGGILSKACDYIQELRQSNHRLSEELQGLDQLQLDNEVLRQQVSYLSREPSRTPKPLSPGGGPQEQEPAAARPAAAPWRGGGHQERQQLTAPCGGAAGSLEQWLLGRACPALPTSGTRLGGSEGVSGSSLQGVNTEGHWRTAGAHPVSVLDAGHTQWACLVPADETWLPRTRGFRGSPFPWSSGVYLRVPGDRLQRDGGEGTVVLPQEKAGQRLRLVQMSREKYRQGPRGPSPLWGRFPLFLFFRDKVFRAAIDSRLSLVGPRADGGTHCAWTSAALAGPGVGALAQESGAVLGRPAVSRAGARGGAGGGASLPVRSALGGQRPWPQGSWGRRRALDRECAGRGRRGRAEGRGSSRGGPQASDRPAPAVPSLAPGALLAAGQGPDQGPGRLVDVRSGEEAAGGTVPGRSASRYKIWRGPRRLRTRGVSARRRGRPSTGS